MQPQFLNQFYFANGYLNPYYYQLTQLMNQNMQNINMINQNMINFNTGIIQESNLNKNNTGSASPQVQDINQLFNNLALLNHDDNNKGEKGDNQ